MTDLITATRVRTGHNDGIIQRLDQKIGNPTYGQGVFLTGQERPMVVHARLIRTPHQVVTGVISGAAYADGDALGTRFTVSVPTAGTIRTVLLTDMDKEALSVSMLMFDKAFDGGTDNAAFDLTDNDREAWVGSLSVTNFESLNDNALGLARGAWDYVAPQGQIWIQALTRGAQNLSAGTDYGVSFVIEDHS